MLNILPVMALISSMQVMQPVMVKNEQLEIIFVPRTPDQMASFYEARGFPRDMRDILKKQCFITVGILNTSDTKIWLDLKHWRFFSGSNVIKRETRDYWKQRWQAMQVPLNKQSTFRWTLLPEQLDYLPGEDEGGNIILPFTKGKFSLTATFATGDDKDGEMLSISTDDLFCAEDAQ